MKIKISMKDPDALIDAMDSAYGEIVSKLMNKMGLSQDGAEAEAKSRLDKMRDFAARYFKYGEYIQVEIDDEAETITVLEK